jgi:MFS family permease
MAMLYRVFPPEERLRAASILTVPTTFAPALGPVLGGLFVTELSWRWVFYVNLPIGVAAAFGVMGGAQLASRLLYPRLGPRRHITLGLVGTSASIGLLAVMGPQTSLWWARLLMFTLGLSMAQVFVPVQAAAFATITPAATGRASTMFNAIRQLGGAVGVAVLTTVIVLVGPVHLVNGHEVANLTAYRVAFLTAAAICLAGVACSLSIRDADAAGTIPRRGGRAGHQPGPVAAEAA